MISDIALFITAVGVLGGVYGLRQSYRERLRQFEVMYVNRYWAIQDRLSIDALKGADPKTISHNDEHAIRAYIILCEDELDMREAGFIGDNTYALWAAGMRQQLKQPMFCRIWKQIQTEKTFPFDHLGQLELHADYEPCKLSTWQRRMRGLRGIRGV